MSVQSELQFIRQSVERASRMRTPVRIRGSGSKDFYGQTLDGAVLEVGRYDGIVDYDPAELVLTARAGASLAMVEQLLADHGQMLPFEPPQFEAGGTIGGAIATGLSGPRRAYAGAARDFVLGVRLIDGLGRDLRFGGQVMKNVAGYDVSRLMCGAMGTLGVLLEVSMKVLPVKSERTLRFECDETSAIEKMNAWCAKALPLSATCYQAGALYVRLSASEPVLGSTHARLGGDEMLDSAGYWRSIRDQSAEFFREAQMLWRVSVSSTAPALGLRAPQLMEWGGALRWLAGGLNADELRATAAKHGGHVTLFRGPRASGVPVFHPLSPAILRVHRDLKRAFDPNGILNPRRMYEL